MLIKGLLRQDYVNKHYHVEWSFDYTINPAGTDIQNLEKMDLECVDGREQIKIWNRSIRAFIQEKTDVVSVSMYLPQQVDRIIIFHFGQSQPVCYAENIEDGIKVYPGKKQ